MNKMNKKQLLMLMGAFFITPIIYCESLIQVIKDAQEARKSNSPNASQKINEALNQLNQKTKFSVSEIDVIVPFIKEEISNISTAPSDIPSQTGIPLPPPPPPATPEKTEKPKIEPVKKPKEPAPKSERADLLEQIRKGTHLKETPKTAEKKEYSPETLKMFEGSPLEKEFGKVEGLPDFEKIKDIENISDIELNKIENKLENIMRNIDEVDVDVIEEILNEKVIDNLIFALQALSERQKTQGAPIAVNTESRITNAKRIKQKFKEKIEEWD